MSVTILCYLFQNIYVHSTIPCGYRFANMYKLSVIVIDKFIGLGGTISTCKSILMSNLPVYTIYHQNKRLMLTLVNETLCSISLCSFKLSKYRYLAYISSMVTVMYSLCNASIYQVFLTELPGLKC